MPEFYYGILWMGKGNGRDRQFRPLVYNGFNRMTADDRAGYGIFRGMGECIPVESISADV